MVTEQEIAEYAHKQGKREAKKEIISKLESMLVISLDNRFTEEQVIRNKIIQELQKDI